jgi:hypothetical protein
MSAVTVHEYVYVPGAEMAYCSCGWEHAGEDADDCDEAWELHCAAEFEALTTVPPPPGDVAGAGQR